MLSSCRLPRSRPTATEDTAPAAGDIRAKLGGTGEASDVYWTLRPSPDFSSYFGPELAVRSKRQITKGIGNEEAVEWKTVCVAPDQSVCSACFAKRANAARDQRSILARTALSLRFCL